MKALEIAIVIGAGIGVVACLLTALYIILDSSWGLLQ